MGCTTRQPGKRGEATWKERSRENPWEVMYCCLMVLAYEARLGSCVGFFGIMTGLQPGKSGEATWKERSREKAWEVMYCCPMVPGHEASQGSCEPVGP